MTDLIKEGGQYASQYYANQKSRISIKEKLKSKQVEVNKKSYDMQKYVTHGKNNIEL